MRPETACTFLLAALLLQSGCGSSPAEQGKFEMFVDDGSVSSVRLSFLKGRCLSRVEIAPKGESAQAALVAFGRYVADRIPLDGSAPAHDAELVALIPAPPLPAGLEGWAEDLSDQVEGPWLITTNAFDWIDGGGTPFAENGFMAAAGEKYSHAPEEWHMEIELVSMETGQGAAAAFLAAKWDSGTKL